MLPSKCIHPPCKNRHVFNVTHGGTGEGPISRSICTTWTSLPTRTACCVRITGTASASLSRNGTIAKDEMMLSP